MSREILEAVRAIEKEKGIEAETLIEALEDALLAAYKKTPGAARHAEVLLDHASGDFRVYAIEVPADLEERLLDEARERKLDELEAAEAETGEKSHTLISDDDLDLDWSAVPAGQISRRDVTPENFGRIAAQTAKQVILQRIREAERAMMYDGTSTASARSSPASSSRRATATTCSSTWARWRRCCPAPSRSTESGTSRAAASRR